MIRGVLEACLTKEQREAGLYLEEDEDFLYLYDREGKRHGVFSSKGAKEKSIREAAQRVMEADHA